MQTWGTYTVPVVRQPTEEQRERWLDQGDLIRRFREAKPMSQADLGTHLSLSTKTVIQIEKGRRPLNQWEMDVLIEVLGMSPRSFIDPPMRSQTVSAPLDDYLAEFVGEVGAAAARSDRRRRDRRTRRKPPSPPL